MADIKIPANLPATVARPMSGARAEAIRSAQRAFFQAATVETPARPEPKAAKAQPAPTAASSATGVETQRYLRPGSRLDIKV